LLLAVLRRFGARPIRLIGLGRAGRLRVEDQFIAVSNDALTGHAGEIALRTVAVADGARIAVWGIDRADHGTVRPDALKRIRAGRIGCGGIQ